ncbi:predicted protein [Naegleria gruberi]|uniref:Predicted protein n=1 Tax=Naegleria gruberi TaxID=5762 RepID=D2VUD0_NAEGR|nr:uncharacterized protein NAEGRDRAFT_52322 [Naegleria gruberi]EFC39604.1 predicted protein [Naegleria gruberi]|eukprot:XP_002672348.1 predicted protein [Naegleria gruberi strain NEG-M]
MEIEDGKAKSSQKEEVMTRLEKSSGKLQRTNEALQEQLKQERNKAEEQYQKAKQEFEQIRLAIDSCKKSTTRNDQLFALLKDGLEQKVEILQEQLAQEVEKTLNLVDDLARNEKECTKHRNMNENLSEKINELQDENKSLIQSSEKDKAELNLLNQLCEELREKNEIVQKTVQLNEDQFQMLKEQQTENLKNLEETRSWYNALISTKESLFESRKNSYQKIITVLENQIESATKNMKEQEKKSAKYKKAYLELRQKNEQLEGEIKVLTHASQDRDLLRDRVVELTKTAENEMLLTTQNMEKLMTRFGNLDEKSTQLETSELKACYERDRFAEENKELKNKVSDLNSKYETQMKLVNELTSQLKSLKKKKNDYKESSKRNQELVLELEEQVNRQNSLNSIASPIKEILTNIGNDSQQEIEDQSLCNILLSTSNQNENNQNSHHNTTTE